jgi:photosystem II stability/assembly factor-like uncharacterized protein
MADRRVSRCLLFAALTLFSTALVASLLLLAAHTRQALASAARSATLTVASGQWPCFDPGSVEPCRSNLNDVALLSATDGWAVGNGGIILHWDGNAWRPATSPTQNTLRAAALVSARDGWAVGDGGTILRWDGNAWTVAASPVTQTLRGVTGTAAEAWAVGDLGTILRWHNGAWSTVTQTAGSALFDVGMVSATDGWIVGGTDGGGAVVLRYDGANWQPQNVLAPELYALAPVTAGNIWAVGYWGYIAHWDGTDWTTQVGPQQVPLADVAFASAGDGWAVGGGPQEIVIHWNGSTWSEVPVSTTNRALSAVSVTPGGDGWAVGPLGQMLRLDAGAWTPLASPAGYDLYGVDMLSETDGWAVGGWDGGDILRWNGSRWSLYSQTPDYLGTLRAVSMVSATDGWAVGSQAMYRWDGNAWTFHGYTLFDQRSVRMRTATDGWMVAENDYGHGVIFHWEGATWEIVTITQNILNAVVPVAAGDAWAVGDGGAILRWNGSAWLAASSPTTRTLSAIDMAGPGNGWAVGASGMILRWDGVQWSVVSGPATTDFYAVRARSPEDVWIAGAAGTILHWDGAMWTQAYTPARNNLRGIALLPSGSGWIVGDNAVVLRYVPFATGVLLPFVSR